MALTQVTVTATFQKAPGVASSANLAWQLSADLYQAGQPVLNQAPVPFPLDTNGHGSVVLTAGDDVGTEPAGTTWTLAGWVDNVPFKQTYVISKSMAPTIDLSQLAPAAVADPSLPVNAVELQGFPVSAGAPVSGQVLEWNGTEYVPTTPAAGGGVSSFNTRTGAVTLQKADVTGTGLAAADVGADTSGAAATAQANAESFATSAAAAAQSNAEGYADTAKLAKSANLSDLANASTARTNLGLGTAATQPSSAFDAVGAAATVQTALTAETSRAETAEALLAPLASPALTGTPTAPTPTTSDSSTKIATTAYVRAQSASYAPASAVVLTPSGDTTGATDTAAIQTALNNAYTAGGGKVYLGPASPTAPFWVTQLKLRSLVYLFGSTRQATCLKVPTGQTAGTHAIVPYDNTTYDYGCFDFTLDGGNGSTTTGAGLQANTFDGIHIDESAGTGLYGPYQGDNMAIFERLFVVNFSGSGVSEASKSQEIRFRNVYAENCYVNGWYLNGWDTFITDCTAGNSGEHGWNMTGSAQSYQMTNCKGWSSGQHAASGHQNDFNIGGSYNSLDACYSEGALAYGFSVSGTTNRVRGYATGCAAAPVDIYQATDCDVDVSAGALNDSFEPNYILRTDGTASTGRVRVGGTISDYHTAALQTVTACPNLNIVIGNSDGGSQSVAYAASITPNIIKGSNIFVGALTGTLTIANPPTGYYWQGATMTLVLPQDSTGGRTVTFGTNYKTASAITTTASTTTSISFVCDGTVWHETGRAAA